MKDEARLDELVAACLKRVEECGNAQVESVCADHPELATAVQSRVDRLGRLGLIGDIAEPTRVDRYRLLRRIGAGGMGDVYLAQQAEPMLRLVALKILKRGMDTDRTVARFELERQALGMLNHDGIARIHDAGTTRDGRLYFAMELVDGEPIHDWCRRHDASIDQRLRLIIDAAQAVEHAHQVGIVHRDLKPSNILVAGDASAPRVKIIDFGLAKTLDAPHEHTLTEPGHIVGTLDYLAPEQTGAPDGSAPRRIDTRTDVHALGIVLYQLLTAHHPLPMAPLGERGLPEAVKAIREHVPQRPSARVAASDGSGETSRRLRGDLDWIVGRALEKDPDRRYSSAAELAEDLTGHRRHLPVRAGPPSKRYALGRFVRRHRGAVAAAFVIALLSAVAAGGLWAAARENARSKVDFERLEEARTFGTRLLAPPPATPATADALSAWIDEMAKSCRRIRSAVAVARDRTPNDSRGRVLLEGAREILASVDDAEHRALPLARHRLRWAQGTEQRTITEQADAWRDALARIARHPRYAGVTLRPQAGLIPLGPDPTSTLEEFAAPIPGATVPTRIVGRPVRMTRDACPVFVLIPPTPGRCWLGAQRDPAKPNCDPYAQPNEGPPYAARVSAFFLGKHELSIKQWLSLTQPTRPETLKYPLNPAVNMSWTAADATARDWGFRLPTETEWERALRAGSTSPWSTGDTAGTLRGASNLNDASHQRFYHEPAAVPWNDRRIAYDSIDSGSPQGRSDPSRIRPNRFGLHHMNGNVAEFCSDDYTPRGAGRTDARGPAKVRRGASFRDAPVRARAAFRNGIDPSTRNTSTGVRLARTIDSNGAPSHP